MPSRVRLAAWPGVTRSSASSRRPPDRSSAPRATSRSARRRSRRRSRPCAASAGSPTCSASSSKRLIVSAVVRDRSPVRRHRSAWSPISRVIGSASPGWSADCVCAHARRAIIRRCPTRPIWRAGSPSCTRGAQPLLLPNPWDVGSARLLRVARLRGARDDEQRLRGHARAPRRRRHPRRGARARRARSSPRPTLPVSADLENGFADDPAGVAETVRLAVDAGLAGCSIEDYTGDATARSTTSSVAAERIAAAAQAAHAGPAQLVLTARAENHIHGRADLDDTIARLRAYGEAGADVLYAPGPARIDDIRRVVAAVGRPVNVLAVRGAPAGRRARRGRRRADLDRRRVRVRGDRRGRRGRARAARGRHLRLPGARRRGLGAGQARVRAAGGRRRRVTLRGEPPGLIRREGRTAARGPQLAGLDPRVRGGGVGHREALDRGGRQPLAARARRSARRARAARRRRGSPSSSRSATSSWMRSQAESARSAPVSAPTRHSRPPRRSTAALSANVRSPVVSSTASTERAPSASSSAVLVEAHDLRGAERAHVVLLARARQHRDRPRRRGGRERHRGRADAAARAVHDDARARPQRQPRAGPRRRSPRRARARRSARASTSAGIVATASAATTTNSP